jgi:hypothetical protein
MAGVVCKFFAPLTKGDLSMKKRSAASFADVTPIRSERAIRTPAPAG